MAKERISSSSASGGFVSTRPEQLGRTNASPQWSVIVADRQPSRLERIRGVIADCGAAPRSFDALSGLRPLRPTADCALVVIALDSVPSPQHANIEAIRVLKQHGFKILAYEDGLQSWPMTARCLPLLAGATRLLDSSEKDFPGELRRLVIQLRQLETERSAEERQVREVMLNLNIVGESRPMLAVFRTVLRVSVVSDLPTLLTGETGTGKECLARAIHQLDPKRRTGPFIALNCGALTPSLAESELFGHRRGAFTGAERERKGLIRAADGGVLFLDEIGEFSETLQAKLLRVLQESRVLAVGDEREVPVSIRVVAATNRDLAEMVQQGRFRADLFHRLNVLGVRVPALRERQADILPLVQFFLAKHRSLKPGSAVAVSAEFVEALKLAELPGNVRQLESLICHALVNKETDTPLGLSDLPFEILWQLSAEEEQPALDAPAAPLNPDGEPPPSDLRTIERRRWEDLLDGNGGSLLRSLDCCEKALLAVALHRTRGNQSQTARLLGITARSVYNKLRKHQLHS